MQQLKTNKKKTAEVETSLHSESSQFALYKDLEGYHDLTSGATRLFLQNKQEKAKDLKELLQKYNFSPSYISEMTLYVKRRSLALEL